MYKAKVITDFSGAHNLRGYKGKCEDLHGHNWKVEVTAKAEELDKLGMVIDFTILKKYVKEIMNELDHKYLNDIEYFKTTNPTSENIAKYIYDYIENIEPTLNLDHVSVWETDSAVATYSR